jgi:hypothetical protein
MKLLVEFEKGFCEGQRLDRDGDHYRLRAFVLRAALR